MNKRTKMTLLWILFCLLLVWIPVLAAPQVSMDASDTKIVIKAEAANQCEVVVKNGKTILVKGNLMNKKAVLSYARQKSGTLLTVTITDVKTKKVLTGLVKVVSRIPDNVVKADFNYVISDNKATITGLKNNPKDLIIPEKINGVTVTSIGNGAFKNMAFGKLRIPDTIETIGDEAFYSIHVTEEKIFRIPSSVKHAGTYAFSYINGIMAFEVDKNNTSFSTLDGVLFDYYKSKLINYPLDKEGKIFVVPQETKLLYCTSFGNCIKLKKLIIPGDAVEMMGFTFFGTDLTVNGKVGTKLEQSIRSLALDNYKRGKVKFIALESKPGQLEILDDACHGINSDLYSVTFRFTDIKANSYLPLEVYLKNGTFKSAKAVGVQLYRVENKSEGLCRAYLLSDQHVESAMVTFIYQLKGLAKGESITFEYSDAVVDLETGSENESVRNKKTFVPLEMLKDAMDHWASYDIMKAAKHYALWEVADYGTGLLQPDKPITRGEFASILRWYTGVKSSESTYKKQDAIFSDVPYGAKLFDSVTWAVKKQIMDGTGASRFEPHKKITREEVAVILKRVMSGSNKIYERISGIIYKDRGSISDGAKLAVEEVSAAGLMKGDSNKNFKPKGLTTRAEAITMIVKLLD